MTRKKRLPTTNAVERRKTGELRYLGTHVDASVLKRLRIEAIRRDVSVGALVSAALASYLANGAEVSA